MATCVLSCFSASSKVGRTTLTGGSDGYLTVSTEEDGRDPRRRVAEGSDPLAARALPLGTGAGVAGTGAGVVGTGGIMASAPLFGSKGVFGSEGGSSIPPFHGALERALAFGFGSTLGSFERLRDGLPM